jgi:hypothetical protein
LHEIVALGLGDDGVAEAGDEQAAETGLPQPGGTDQLDPVASARQTDIDDGQVELVVLDKVERLARRSGRFDPELGVPEQVYDDAANPGVVIDHKDRRGTHEHPSLRRVTRKG